MTDAKPSKEKITTLEPLLYRATFFVAFATILEDKTPDATIDRLKDLASSVLRHFDAHAQRTPLLYVEALFGHAGAPVDQYCRSLSYDDGVEAYGGVASSRIDSGPVWQGSDEEEAVDDDVFARLAEEDARAAERLKQAKANKPPVDRRRWQPAEDAALCLVYAKVTENDGDFDPVQASRMSVLLPHHRDAKQLRTKKSTSVKKKKASDDDEDSVDDEPIVYDDREMEVDTSLGRTRLETQTERRASESAAPAPWDDEEEVDDRWSDRRTFKGRASEPAPEPTPKTAPKRRRVVVEDEED